MNKFKKSSSKPESPDLQADASAAKKSPAAGFSIIELLVVVAVLGVLSGIAYMGFSSPQKYAADDQALKMLDILQEARQKALTQRRVMRVEFNNTKKTMRLINEYDIKATNSTTGKSLVTDSDDDKEVRSIPFDTKNLVIGNKPGNVTTVLPTQTSAIPEMSFQTTTYPLSNGNSVFTLCFVKDGRVLSPGTNGLCEPDKDDLGGATVYVSEKPDSAGKSKIIRAVTVNSISGSGDVVKCQLNSSNVCTKWVK
jgi:prepilin-type N-terminal cleavage/methylation domain-containing protein